MAFGGLRVFPSKLVILLLIVLYITNLVAIVDRKQPDLQGGLDDDTFQFESLTAALSGEDDGLNVISNLASSVPINFDPPELDFQEQPIGMANIRVITINNPTHSLTLQLISISGNQPDFHSSFFVSKVLRPGESTTFEIVFLPRTLGPVDDLLVIQSSFGTYKYKIAGVGAHNVFRLRPLRGARIPINATYSPSISFYNPFSSPLQIVELYSSGGNLHLELPHGFTEGNKSVWEIRPYETKQIAKALFVGQFISNHTAFVRIKTNHATKPSIVLPLEVEVSEASGLFLSRELLDFGMIKSGGQTRLPLYILNAGPHQVEIKSITPDPGNPSIKVEYMNTTLKPGNKYTKVAVLIFSVEAYPPHTDIEDSGIIKIWAEDKTSFHELKVPYEAHILQGILDYEEEDSLFRAYDPPSSPLLRTIRLSNKFSSPLVIYSAKLSTKAQEIFSVDSFVSPYVLKPDGEWYEPIRLRFSPQSSDCLMNTTLRLSTNASFFNIPLLCYDGSLEHDFGGKEIDSLEFGLMSERDSLSKVFSIMNPNPIRISITSLQVSENSNLPYVAVHLLSLPRQPRKSEVLADMKKGKRPPYYISPGHQMVFSVNVTRPKRPGKFSGEILIYSSLGKVVTVPVNYQAVTGGVQITPKRIQLKPAFPYTTTKAQIHVKSTYTKSIRLLSLSLLQEDRLLPITLPSSFPAINPTTTTVIGEVILNPLLHGQDFNTSFELEDLASSKDGSNLDRDLHHFTSLVDHWDSLIDSGLNNFNFTLTVDTEIDKNITVGGSGSLKWPHLTDETPSTLQFPVTLIGNTSEVSFSLFNPSSQPLQIELVFLNDAQDPEYVLQTLSDKFNVDVTHFVNTTADRVYSIRDKPYKHSYTYNRVTSYKTFPKLLIPPHGNQSLEMEFSPVSDNLANGLLLLRNNLTVFDYIHLKGTGSRGFITVGDIHPGGPTPLHFEYTSGMMETCTVTYECECSSSSIDNSRSEVFVVRNSGPVPMMITGTLGNSGLCEDHGFKLSNCQKPFAVYPNRTRKLEITFTPDFTLSRVTSSLRLVTGSGVLMDFPLLATLPHNMLTDCYNSLPRSELEGLASYVSVPLWLLALLVMILATVFQVNWHTRRLHKALHSPLPIPSGKDVPIQATGGPLFDLSNLAKRVTSTISDKVAELSISMQDSKQSPAEKISKKNLSEVKEELVCAAAPKDSGSPSTTISTQGSTTQEQQLTSNPSGAISSQNSSCGKQQSTTDNRSSEPLESNVIATLPLSTPTKKSTKVKRTLLKVEKSQNPSSSNLSSCSSEEVQSTHSLSISIDKPEQHLSRKESDDSIPEESDQDHSGGSSNGSEQSTLDSEESNSVVVINKLANKAQAKPPSFTKEPGTGQTVMVKDGVEENEAFNCTEKPSNKPVSSSNTSNVVSVSININRPARGRSKKQRNQQKKEEKMKRKKKEKEEAKKASVSNEPQESFDKESISSSTNSTDNLEEDHSVNSEQTTPEDDQTKPVEAITSRSKEFATEDENKYVTETIIPLQVPEDTTSVLKYNDKTSYDNTMKEDDVTADKLSPLTDDVLPLGEEEEDSNIPEMETSCSSIEFKMSGLSPSPDEMSGNKLDSPVGQRKITVNEHTSVDSTGEDTETVSESYTRMTSKSTSSHPSSPDTKPRATNTSSSLPPTPGKGATVTNKVRPSKLDLHEAEKHHQQTQSSTLSSAETDGATKSRLAPHELAATLLKNISRPSKQKAGGSAGADGGNNTKTSVKDKNTEDKDTHQASSHSTSKSSRKKQQTESSSNNKSMGDGGRDKRTTPLSSDAMPFYPPPPPPPHYPSPHHHPHPHVIPPPPGHFPPSSARVPVPPPPSYPPPPLHHPSHLAYEYPMMRPLYPPHQHDDQPKQRKRSDQKYPPKTFSPPFPEMRYPDRPHPFHMPNYDYVEEWMGSHGSHTLPPGYSAEEDPYALSYPIGPRRPGSSYPHSGGSSNIPPPPPSSHSHSRPPMFSPLESGGGGAGSGPEHIFDWSQLTPEEMMYLKEIRQQRIKKMIEKQQQQQLLESSELYDTRDRPMRHTSDPYSLASLRERPDADPSRYPRGSVEQHQSSYHMPSPHIDIDSEMTDAMLLASLRGESKTRQRKPSRDDISWLSSPIGGGPPARSLNRAPGSFTEPSTSSLEHSSNLMSPLSSVQSPSTILSSNDNYDEWGETEKSNKSLPSSAWQSLWTMESPLLSALEEQRQQAAKSTNSQNTYDLFEGGNSHSIWSLNEKDGTFSWITKSNEDDDNRPPP